mmetsp:Transcript_61023/g.175005  ORF Transcript_61023/g.175005 Transcript_61023/m.175005 type:complete len:232 (-) Transcript_61023:7-702(-)
MRGDPTRDAVHAAAVAGAGGAAPALAGSTAVAGAAAAAAAGHEGRGRLGCPSASSAAMGGDAPAAGRAEETAHGRAARRQCIRVAAQVRSTALLAKAPHRRRQQRRHHIRRLATELLADRCSEYLNVLRRRQFLHGGLQRPKAGLPEAETRVRRVLGEAAGGRHRPLRPPLHVQRLFHLGAGVPDVPGSHQQDVACLHVVTSPPLRRPPADSQRQGDAEGGRVANLEVNHS